MKVAVIGSRGLKVSHLENYLPQTTTEIVSGGAQGIDTCAREHAIMSGLGIIEFLPDYGRYGRRAPLLRNERIVQYADLVLAFWDGSSRGTKFVIDYCKKQGVPVLIYQSTGNGKYILLDSYGAR